MRPQYIAPLKLRGELVPLNCSDSDDAKNHLPAQLNSRNPWNEPSSFLQCDGNARSLLFVSVGLIIKQVSFRSETGFDKMSVVTGFAVSIQFSQMKKIYSCFIFFNSSA